jgi:hypothetical protein
MGGRTGGLRVPALLQVAVYSRSGQVRFAFMGVHPAVAHDCSAPLQDLILTERGPRSANLATGPLVFLRTSAAPTASAPDVFVCRADPKSARFLAHYDWR